MKKGGIILCFFLAHLTIAQTPVIESLRKKVRNAKPQDKAQLYNQLSYEFRTHNGDSVVKYALKAREYAIKSDNTQQLVIAYKNLGIGHEIMSDFENAMLCYDSAINLARRTKYVEQVPNLANNMANIFWYRGDYVSALRNYYQAKEGWLKAKNHRSLSTVYSNIALSYMQIGEYDSCFNNLVKAEEMALIANDETELVSCYVNRGNLRYLLKEYDGAMEMLKRGHELAIKHNFNNALGSIYECYGEIYTDLNKLDSAKYYFKESLSVYNSTGNKSGASSIQNQLGKVSFLEADYELAMDYLQSAYRVKKQIDDRQGIPPILNAMSECQISLGQLSAAYASAIESRDLALETGSKKSIMDVEHLLYKISQEQENYLAGNRHLLSYYMYKDSLISEENLLKISRSEFKDELSQKQNELTKLEQANRQQFSQLEQQRLDIANTRLMVFALIAIVVLYGMASVVWYWYHRRRTKMLQVLTKMNLEIASQKEKIEMQSMTLEKTNSEIRQMNASLEDTIRERTQVIMEQNEKLKSFAYSNSHHVRASLTRILGLTNLFQLHKSKNKEIEFITDNISESARELDRVTRKLSSDLDDIVSQN